MPKKLTLIWLLLGLGSRLQVVASLSITEIIVLVATPSLLMKNHLQMRRDGIWPLFIVSLLVILGCIVGSIANQTPLEFVLRGLAVTCLISCTIIFSHWILRKDPGGFKWYILMVPLSAILSTFIFKSSVEMSMLGESSEEIISGPIYWITRLNPLIMAPVKGWYLQTPVIVNIFAPLFMAGFSMLTTISGRSAALGSVAFVALVIIGGKRETSMIRVSRNFWKICAFGVILIAVLYISYKTSARLGWLGEEARIKYERQTSGGQGGIGRLLLGGRAEAFIGLLACRDKPIVGWGPWAADENGYTEEFIEKYGTPEDVTALYKIRYSGKMHGNGREFLSCHAYLTEFWAWYGIAGLIFWIYIIFILLRYLKEDCYAVPQWFAWLACSIPSMFWGIFFSPFQDRFGVPMFVVACLMARAVRKGMFRLPFEMIQELEKEKI